MSKPIPPQPAAEIAYCRIHPGLGIARIGNSPDDYFIGPEAPGEIVEPEDGYKDSLGRIKRQAARFRIYAYDANDKPIRELTSEEANITWTVHLANRKAAHTMFLGSYWQSQYPDFYKVNPNQPPLRNQSIPADSPDRALLVIDPGPRSIAGCNARDVRFDGGTIGPLPYTLTAPLSGVSRDQVRASRNGYLNVPAASLKEQLADGMRPPADIKGWTPNELLQPVGQSDKVEVPLGELRTDADGRLLVLGGAGKSGSLIADNPIGYLNTDTMFANNDYWYDDISDGPVSAKVVLNGKELTMKDQAWVLVGVPKFVPAAETLTTLYDIAREAAGVSKVDDPVSFVDDVYPLLRRLDIFTWLNKTANRGHGSDTAQGSFFGPENKLFHYLHDPSKDAAVLDIRKHVFDRLRPPGLVPVSPDAKDTRESLAYANMKFMPQMSGDGGQASAREDASTEPDGGNYITWLALSPVQYAKLKRWAVGDFIDDWPKDNVPPENRLLHQYPVAEQPAALDRAALQPCVGGAFYPGIEMTYISRYPDTWGGLCRINPATPPGGISQFMALPWQADFSECNTNWWPAQRPDDVVSQEVLQDVLKSYDRNSDSLLSSVLSKRVPWARGIPTDSPGLDNAMVEAWKDFGFVVAKKIDGQTVMVETERSPYVGRSIRDYFYYLMNIPSYLDFLPRAHSLVHEMLAEAWKNQDEADSDEVWKFFPFSQNAFDARMDLIYDNFVRDATATSALLAKTPAYLTESRSVVVNGIFQMAPFNQLDGAWLRSITPDGPVGSVDSLLFSIRMDEMGDGNIEQNHANVYTDLLKSLNIYLPDLHTREYAYNSQLYDSAFTQPVFLLAISQFGDEFMPELLGMTLYLEWSAIGLLSSVDQMKAFGINPLYYSLHLGIDNASAGHGAIAKTCVEMYLDQVRESEGEDAMQAVWRRIWNGYVAFGTLGNLGEDLANAALYPPTPEDKLVAMIQSKAPYASRAHREKMLGPNLINDWMLDPQGLLQEMQNSGLIVPGDLEHSAIFQLIGFNGPMYHVFTAAEQKLWQDYVLYLGRPKPAAKPKSQRELLMMTIDFMRQRQNGVTGHNVLLKGPNPAKGGGKITQSIQQWFALNDNDALLGALADQENGWVVVKDPQASPLVTSMLAGTGDMATAFQAEAPDSGGRSYKSILVQWIIDGCPIGEKAHAHLLMAQGLEAGAAPAKVAPLPPLSIYVSKAKDGRRRRIWGMGAPH